MHSRYIVEPFAVGATILSVVCSLVAYPLTLRALRAYRSRKAPNEPAERQLTGIGPNHVCASTFLG